MSHPRDGDDVAGDEVVDDFLASDGSERLAEIIAHAHVVDQDTDVQIGQLGRHLPVDGSIAGKVDGDRLDMNRRLEFFYTEMMEGRINHGDRMSSGDDHGRNNCYQNAQIQI